MNALFDDISRAVASSISRREVMKFIVAAVVGGTRTQIDNASFSSFDSNLLDGNDLSVSGMGTARVNGVPTNITFTASEIQGVAHL